MKKKIKVIVEGKEVETEVDIDDPTLIEEIVKLQKDNVDLKKLLAELTAKFPITSETIPTPSEKTLLQKFIEFLKDGR